MKLAVLEKSDNKLVLEVKGETHTLLNLLSENTWKSGADQASYIIQHPYLSEPKIIVRSKNPKKTLLEAVQLIVMQSKEFEKEFQINMKRKK
jgi:DNA-directed RNA polymerase subunit L